ncbi:MAG: lytic transglycosylase domain-containing protein [Holosporales bacterium]|nr:lytic transglycosylase domain-containing protein [Holosporales bacterium]
MSANTEKYDKWKTAIMAPENSTKVFAFFYNNPHWPLFDESIKVAERNIDSSMADRMIVAWFKRYPPTTSDGLMAFIDCLIKEDPQCAQTYIKQTWIYQNLATQFIREFRKRYEKYLSAVDDAKKAKYLTKVQKIEQLKELRAIIHNGQVSTYIDSFLKKYFLSKSKGHSKADLSDPQKRSIIIQQLINQRRMKDAASILTLTNKNEEEQSDTFYKQRRHVAYEVLRSGSPQLAYDVMKMYKIRSKNKDERIAKAEWLMGYIVHRFLNDQQKAEFHFERAYNNSKKAIRLSKNAFWLAEVYQKRGDILLALDWYQKASRHFSTFYGYLAKARVQALNNEKLSILSTAAAPPTAPILTDREMVFYNRELVQVLLAVQDRGMAQHFYRQLIREIEDPDEEVLLLDLAYANDEVDILISENSRKQHYFSSPKAYKRLGSADAQTVERIEKGPCFMSLVHAIIHRESNFNAGVKSHAGAIGLMQVMPATAQQEARRIRFRMDGRSLFDRFTNLTIGSSYIHKLMQKYDNNVVFAAAAYNCGEGCVSKYQKSLKNLKGLTLLDLMELMPIKETRIYLKHVVRALFAYSEMFFAGSCYNCSFFLNIQ